MIYSRKVAMVQNIGTASPRHHEMNVRMTSGSGQRNDIAWWYLDIPSMLISEQPTAIQSPAADTPCALNNFATVVARANSPQPVQLPIQIEGIAAPALKYRFCRVESTSSVQIHAHANAKWSIGLSKTDHADLQLRYPACTTQTCICAQIHKYKNANAQIQKRRWGRSMTLIPHPTESTIAAYCAVLCFAKIDPIASLFILSAQWATM